MATSEPEDVILIEDVPSVFSGDGASRLAGILQGRYGVTSSLVQLGTSSSWVVGFSDPKSLLDLLKDARKNNGIKLLSDGSCCAVSLRSTDEFTALGPQSSSEQHRGEEDCASSSESDKADGEHNDLDDDDWSSSASEQSYATTSEDDDDEAGEAKDVKRKRDDKTSGGTSNLDAKRVKFEESGDKSASSKLIGPKPQGEAHPENKTMVVTFVPKSPFAIQVGHPAITPFLVYQALCGSCIPKRIVICKPSIVDSDDGERRQKSTIRVLVEVETLEDKAKLFEMSGVVVRMMTAASVNDERGEATLSYVVFVKESASLDKLHVQTNTEKAFGVTAALQHMLGPMFERRWVGGAPPQKMNQSHNQSFPPATPVDQANNNARVAPTDHQVQAPPPNAGHQRGPRGHPQSSNLQGQQERPNHHAPAHQQQQPQQYQQPAYNDHQPQYNTANSSAPAAAAAAPANAGPPSAPPPLPPGWEAFYDERYGCFYYSRQNPSTGQRETSWTLPTV